MSNEELIAKIKAEVERLKAIAITNKSIYKPSRREYDIWCQQEGVCENILSFISTLKEPDKGLDVTDFSKPIDSGIAQCVADHWFEMADEEPVCEELDDETLRVEFKKIERKCFDEGITGWQKEKLIARHFANWQERQDAAAHAKELQDCLDMQAKHIMEDLMEEAVEGEYDCQYATPAVFLDKYLDGIKDGDKVRIIILKDNE